MVARVICAFLGNATAIQYFGAKWSIGMREPTISPPSRALSFAESTRLIGAGFREWEATSYFGSAQMIESPDDIMGESVSFVDKQFDEVASLSRNLPFIERCAIEPPKSEERHFDRRRRRHVDYIVRYVLIGSSGDDFVVLSDAVITMKIASDGVTRSPWRHLESHDARSWEHDLLRN
jgi:hypothetical protein